MCYLYDNTSKYLYLRGNYLISDEKYQLDELIKQLLFNLMLGSNPQNKITVFVVGDFSQLYDVDTRVCCCFL